MLFTRASAALAFATLALATPLTQSTNTAIAIESIKPDSAALIVHIIRTDDLLSDSTPTNERALILERMTHMVLKIALDTGSNSLSINDGKVDLAQLGAVQVAKVDALLLPKEAMMVEGQMMTPVEMASLAQTALPAGLVGTEITIEEDNTDALVDAEDRLRNDMTLSIKTYKLSLKITEIEALALAHTTSVSVPILRLQLAFASLDGAITRMSAFSLPSPRRIAEVDAVESKPLRAEPSKRPWGSRKCNKGRKPAFMRWIANVLGGHHESHEHEHEHRKPHHDDNEVNKADEDTFFTQEEDAPHRRPDHGPEREHDPKRPQHGPPRHGPPHHDHEHKHHDQEHDHEHGDHPHGPHGAPHHGRPHGHHPRFLCRLRHSFRSTLFALRSITATESFLIGAAFVKFMTLFAVFFVVARRAKKVVQARREGAVRLADEEEVVVVVEEEKEKVETK